MERNERKILKQDLIWSFGGATGVAPMVWLLFDYDMQGSLLTGVVFLLGSLIITFSRGVWRRGGRG